MRQVSQDALRVKTVNNHLSLFENTVNNFKSMSLNNSHRLPEIQFVKEQDLLKYITNITEPTISNNDEMSLDSVLRKRKKKMKKHKLRKRRRKERAEKRKLSQGR
ncbi:hypothetical protein C6P45_005194 [Maudiozyma exigua]|uniref:Ribosomal protein mS38 C-terminal domain-containing protein n=1 Tax=Maudiozyma exigua TaxID=34358 RepID=A0A9P6WC49_MAUEX|nr:hypothetical protein C6P45_005194 [Kazachstania exigua]